MNTKNLHLLLAQLPRTQFTQSNAPDPRARKASTQIFASPIGTASPKPIYTQQRAKPECHEDINTIFSHLRPIGTATPNEFKTQQCAKPACQEDINTKFRISYWHSYPERNLHTATRQTRMPGRHQHKIFASPTGAATTPNAIYTQQRPKPACQEDINTKFSHLLLAQLPRTQFTHSNAPNSHARKTSTQNCRISSYWQSYLPRTQFTHKSAPNPHAKKTSTQKFRISYGHSYPEHLKRGSP